MKVRQFLKKFLFASSTVRRIFVVHKGETTQLIGVIADPMAANPLFERQLNAVIVSFRINGEDLTIYAK